MSVRPESYKIVIIIIFYLLLWTTYLFRQNFAEEKIFASTKYRQRKNIGISKISLSLPAKYRRRKNINTAKISVSTKYRKQQRKNIGIAKISVSTKYRWKLRWRVIKSVEIKVARYQIGGN